MLLPRLTGQGRENTSTTFGRFQPALWDIYQRRARTADITEDGIHRSWDFDNWGDTADSVTLKDGWTLHTDTGNSVVQVTAIDGGVLRLTTTTTDNNSVDIMEGGNVGQVSITSAGTAMTAFDCRVRFTQVTNTYNMFAGLTAAGSAADNGFFSDAGATADRACFGFTVLESGGAALEFTYKKAGQTAQITTGLKTIVGATWYCLGAIVDTTEPNPAHRVKIFIDNAVVAYLSDTDLAAATFPSAVSMGFGMSIKNQTNVGKSWDIDCAARAMSVA